MLPSLNWSTAEPVSIDALSRQLDTLYHVGNDTSMQITALNSGANIFNAWGTLPGQSADVADTALALMSILDASNSYSSNSLGNALCNVFIPGQTASGGWGYTPRPAISPSGIATPAILPTAYSILALQKINATGLTSLNCGGPSIVLTTLINNGITWLLTKKNADNGFGENGTSGVLETALAYRAIAAIVPDNTALGPAQDYLIANQQSNGAWVGDALQTAFVVQTFPVTVLADSQNTGVPDAVAALIWSSGVNNARSLIAGNGQSIVGQTISLVVGVGRVGQSFQASLAAPAGGSGQYTYKLLSGNLPDGVTLAADGTLSGTPTMAGTFSFSYQVIDANNIHTTVAAQIVASTPPPPLSPGVIAVLLNLLLDD